MIDIKKIILVAIISFICSTVISQNKKMEISVWGKEIVESNGIVTPEICNEEGHILNISDATISVIFPNDGKNDKKIAVLICPGGGYGIVAAKHEGFDFAEWLADNGIVGIVLKYRLPNKNHKIPLMDAQKAMQIIRENSDSWGIDSSRVGVMGFSAGGHLASTLLTHSEDIHKPDFGVLFYSVISFDKRYTHRGTVNNLLGGLQSVEILKFYSNELQVKEDTPSTLLLHCDDDEVVSSQNSILYYNALKEQKIKASLYIFPKGKHGWGFDHSFPYHEQMKAIVLDWLDKFLKH